MQTNTKHTMEKPVSPAETDAVKEQTADELDTAAMDKVNGGIWPEDLWPNREQTPL